MGQKTNPIIFQLGKTKKWQYAFHEKKQVEFAKYSENHLEIQQFICKYFKNYGLKVCGYDSAYTGNQLIIFVSYFITDKTFKLMSDEDKKLKKKTDTRRVFSKKKGVHFFMKKLSRFYKHQSLLNKTANAKKFTIISSSKQPNKSLKLIKKLSYKNNLFRKILIRQKVKKKNSLNQKLKNFEYRQSYWKKKRKFGIDFAKKSKNATQKREKSNTKYTRFINSKTFNSVSLGIKTFTETLETSFLNKLLETINLLHENSPTIVLNVKQINKDFFENFTKSQFEIFKKILGQLRRFNKETYTNEGLYTTILFLRSQHSVEFFAEYVAAEMQKHKRQHSFLSFIQKALVLLNKSKLYGLTDVVIKVKGRFNGAPRSKIRVIKIGRDLSVISVKSKISYAEKISFSSNGTFGVKVWATNTEKKNVTGTKKYKIQEEKKRQIA